MSAIAGSRLVAERKVPETHSPVFVVAVRPLGAREDLVPGAEERPLALDEQGVGRRGRHELAQRHEGGEARDLGGGRRAEAVRGGGAVVAECDDALVDLGGVDAQASDRGGEALEHPDALGAHEVLVDAGGDLDAGVVHPRGVGVGPALDAVGPPPLAVGDDGRRPLGEPGVDAVHREVVVVAVGVGEHGRRVDGVVALAEDLGPDRELLADDRLRRTRAAVDERTDVAHGDASHRERATRHTLDGRRGADRVVGGEVDGSCLGVVDERGVCGRGGIGPGWCRGGAAVRTGVGLLGRGFFAEPVT